MEMWQYVCNICYRSWSKAESELASLREQSYNLHFFLFFLPEASMIFLLCFCSALRSRLVEQFVRVRKGMDGNIRFQFQVKASLFSEGDTPKRNTLFLGGDECTLRIIISMPCWRGENWTIYWKPEFIFWWCSPRHWSTTILEEGNRFTLWTEIGTIYRRASATILWRSSSL